MSGPILLALRIILVILLYAFVGWGLLTLWQDLRRQSRLAASPQLPAVTFLMQVEGKTRQFHFTSPEITIGRDPACNFMLEDQTISAQHSRLSFHHGQWWVEDLHSTNGTFLNQENVSEAMVLTNGDQLRCGQVVLNIVLGDHRKLEVERKASPADRKIQAKEIDVT